VGGCSSQRKSGAAKAKQTHVDAQATRKTSSRDLQREKVQREAQSLLTQWLIHQNKGELAKYLSFYDSRVFSGVKRAQKAGLRRLNFKEWSKDRALMFKTPQVVAAEEIEISTWLDPRSRLRDQSIDIMFVQRWRNATYADHGKKLLRLFRPDAKSAFRIIYEELFTSTQGWAPEKVETASVIDLGPVPADEDALWALWGKLAPTLADTKIDAVEDDNMRKALFKALIKRGNFRCDETEEEPCGGPLSWAVLPGETAWPSPCVQREVLIHLLNSESLDANEVAALTKPLMAMLSLPLPEEEVQLAIIDFIKEGHRKLLPSFLKEVAHMHWNLILENKYLETLSANDVAEIYDLYEYDEALLHLQGEGHLTRFIDALTDEQLRRETRLVVLEDKIHDLPGKEITSKLLAVRNNVDDCELAAQIDVEINHRTGRPALQDPKVLSQQSPEKIAFEICKASFLETSGSPFLGTLFKTTISKIESRTDIQPGCANLIAEEETDDGDSESTLDADVKDAPPLVVKELPPIAELFLEEVSNIGKNGAIAVFRKAPFDQNEFKEGSLESVELYFRQDKTGAWSITEVRSVTTDYGFCGCGC